MNELTRLDGIQTGIPSIICPPFGEFGGVEFWQKYGLWRSLMVAKKAPIKPNDRLDWGSVGQIEFWLFFSEQPVKTN